MVTIILHKKELEIPLGMVLQVVCYPWVENQTTVLTWLMIMIEGHVFSVCRFGGGNPELLKAMVAGGHLGMNGIL